jgi:hypothetical protein
MQHINKMSEEIVDQPSAAQIAASYVSRARDFEDDSATLGQKNLDEDLRTTITQAAALGLGFVGTVCRVGYGTWQQRHALILLMKFDFRVKTGLIRFKRADITIRFEPYNSRTVTPPIVRQFYPKSNNSIPEMTTGTIHPMTSTGTSSSRTVSNDVSQHGPVAFKLKAKLWGTHSVIWTITGSGGNDVNLPEHIYLAAIVETEGFCKAYVDVVAKTTFKIPICVNPWNRDDPLLFNGSTTKGLSAPKKRFDELTDSDWSHFIHGDLNSQASISSKVYRVRGISSCVNEGMLISILLMHGGYYAEDKHVTVLSFTHNPYRSEIIAVVSLPSTYVGSGPNTEEWRITCQIPNQPSLGIKDDEIRNVVELTLDTHFRGFTALGMAPLEMRPQSE